MNHQKEKSYEYPPPAVRQASPYASLGMRGVKCEIGDSQGKLSGLDKAPCKVSKSRRISVVIKILRGQFQRARAHFVLK